MDTIEEAFRASNGTFGNEENKERFCPICMTDECIEDWKKHTKNPGHIATVQQFELLFEIRGPRVCCRICQVDLDWEEVKNHASWHRIAPWHKSDDRHKTFFENHIVELKNQFYCYPCNKIFTDWFVAFVHIKEKKHQKLIKAELPENKSLALPSPEVSYELLAKNAVVAWGTNVRCRICDCADFGNQNIVQHVNGSWHRNRKSIFTTDLKKRMNNRVVGEKVDERFQAEQSTSKQSGSTNGVNDNVASKFTGKNSPRDCVKKKDDADRAIGDIRILDNAVVKDRVEDDTQFSWHTEEESHKHSQKEIKNQSNKQVIPVIKETSVKAVPTKQSHHACDPACKNLPCVYFEKQDDGEFYCKICNRIFIDTEFDVHVAGKRHRSVMQQWSDNKITSIEGNKCYCGYCKCTVLGLVNVSEHIKGNRHCRSQTGMIMASKEQAVSTTSEISVKANSVQQERVCNSVGENLSCVYFEKQESGDFYCRICCYTFTDKEFDIHVSGMRHATYLQRFSDNKISWKKGKHYYCDYCKCIITSFANISEHINGNRHDYFRYEIINTSDKEAVPTTSAVPVKGKSAQLLHSCNSACQTLPCVYFEKYDDGEFYCTICNYIFIENNFNNHVTGKRHASSLQQFNDNKISLSDGNDYYCDYCKCQIPGFDNIAVHIRGNRHKSSQSKIKDISSKPKVSTSNNIAAKVEPKESTSNKIPVKVEPEVSTGNKIPAKIELKKQATNSSEAVCYILKLSETKSFCQICDIDLHDQTTIESHVTGRRHATAFKKYGCDNVSLKEGNNYYCRCCKCEIPGLDNVCRHIKGYRHTNSLTALSMASDNVESVQQRNNCNTVVAVPEVPASNNNPAKVEPTKQATNSSKAVCYISELSASSSFCKICDIHLYGKATIEDHLTGNRHVTTLKKYGCDNISLKNGTTYYCRCCECKIIGLDNVYLHAKGYRHMNSLTVSNKAETPNSRAWDSVISSLSTELAKLTTKPKPVLPQNGRKLPRSKQVFGDLKINSRGEKICCTICNDTVTGMVTLHAHLARHFSVDFIPPSEIKKTDDNIKISSGKDQTEQNGITESQTILNSNGRLVNTGLAMDGKKSFAKREDKIPNMKKILKLLDFDKDYIYSMKDKLMELELGMKLCFATDCKNIYCLICKKNVANTVQDYFDHLYSLDHCVYLDKMENDHGLFDAFPDQFSELNLALEYMEEIADDTVRCLVCEREFVNVDHILREHIDGKKHQKKSKEMKAKAKENFELVKSKVRCDWYQVERYWCVRCFATFQSEVNFVKHLEGEDHAFVMKTREGKRKLIFEFCEPCALLWYGYRCTYAYHCEVPTHQWLARDGYYVSNELPESMKLLLATPEEYIEDKIKHYDQLSVKEREKEQTLIRDMENAVKSKFPNGKAHTFGSRVSGSGSPDSDIDVFLDCGNMYDGNASSMDQIVKFMTDVHECLSKESKLWDVDELLTACRTPIIKAHHRATGLSCDISFENGLAVENTKLIKSFNDIYPSCRKMILFLKQWLTLADLSGYRAITSYALYWYIIFYLQKESILPSIAKLIAMKNKSHIIAGWQVGVDHDFTYNQAESNFSVKELLIRFFTFYANFDFRYEVACPLLGEAVQKRDFADPANLPKEMETYTAYIANSGSPEPFRIDSAMCIQDPFDLQHNLTKAASKVYLSRFRTYCSKSLDILCSSEM